MGRVLPLTAASTLTIVAGLADYAAPVDAIGFIASDWVTRNAGRNPWDPCFVSVVPQPALRSEEHTSELQSLMRISYAVLCLKNINTNNLSNKHDNTKNLQTTTK